MGKAAGISGERLETLSERCVIGELVQPRWPVFVDPKHACVFSMCIYGGKLASAQHVIVIEILRQMRARGQGRDLPTRSRQK